MRSAIGIAADPKGLYRVSFVSGRRMKDEAVEVNPK